MHCGVSASLWPIPCTGTLQHAAWETARLRVRATALAAENDALKTHVSQLMQQISDMDRNVQVRQILCREGDNKTVL